MLLTANAEGGSQGATVSSGQAGSGNAWTGTTGTPLITYDGTHAHNSLAYKVTLSATTTAEQLVWGSASVGTVTDMWGRLYMWPDTAPQSNRIGLVRFLSGGSQAARLIYQTDGTLQLADAGNAAEITTTGAVATGQWTRIEWHVQFVATNASIEVRLFNSAESTTATETITSSSATGIGVGCDSVQIGAYLNGAPSTWTAWLDDIEVNDTAFPGPIPAPADSAPPLRRPQLRNLLIR